MEHRTAVRADRRSRSAILLVIATTALLTSCLLSPKVVPGTYRVPTDPPTSIGDGTTLRLVAVTQDSRCPKNVVCVWEGELTAQVAWSSGGTDTVVDLTWSVHAAPTPVPGTTYSLALDDVVGSGATAVATVRVI